jgi:hypothetical protein
MTNEMHNSYNQFYFTIFLSALHVSNESGRAKHIEQTKKLWNKIDYTYVHKNCASCLSLTQHIAVFT